MTPARSRSWVFSAPTTRLSHPIRRSPLQLCFHLTSTTPDGLLIQAGDLGQQPHPATTQPKGFQRRIPTPLLLIQATEEQIHLAMQLLLGMLLGRLASPTLALMNRFRHRLILLLMD